MTHFQTELRLDNGVHIEVKTQLKFVFFLSIKIGPNFIFSYSAYLYQTLFVLTNFPTRFNLHQINYLYKKKS